MAVSPDILLVVATLVSGFSLASCISAWADRAWPVMALISLALGLGLFGFVHFHQTDGLVWQDIPDAFIGVAALILN
ncbi:hypothetical protein E2K80_16615 [Rhodophyticola sp. CCM32]|uniref:hypothetical protein n=1 Tax=Rhodophyticola sp. CCM32 TaxID=2916397 RepID=UPI00107FB3C3|nr:hypothetical protein [Rhodophyticola sp. CCM32]QBY02159.1 hypothetical protein E2K80_16615 [Rhodophyticola sp. CCM32]